MKPWMISAALCCGLAVGAELQAPTPAAGTVAALEPAHLELRGAKAESVTYRGKRALKLTGEAAPQGGGGDGRGVLKGKSFRDGTIELELAGAPMASAGEAARGFVGIAFRVQGDRFENIYLRPTNGRAEDQVRRNHTVQYASEPDYPWHRLRKEEPEKYETYVDLEPGVWTKVRIVVDGTRARLYVHGATQPTLVVNDLKQGIGEGGVALWIGPGTEGHFANLKITPSAR